MSYPQLQQHSRYGPCDSFFVQNDEDIYSIAERNRERARAIAKTAHRQLGQKLSALTALEYQDDILDHMEFMEGETMPDVNSIDIQTEIQWYMRPYLLDFLIEAHTAFQLLPDTLFLAVNLLDRYCSRRVVYKRHYQLVGCAALLIAAKYGDKKEKVPTVRELRAMCCQLYDEDMFIQMEWHVLQTLNWIVGHPTIDAFLQIALEEEPCGGDVELQHMTWYLCELALFHKEFISVRPSVLARSALALARCILGRPQSKDATWAGRYESPIVLSLANHLSQPSQVLSRKYSPLSLSSVAQTVEYFLQAQRQQPTPEPVAQTPQEPKLESTATMFSSPHTPQKSYGAPTVHYGFLTPPITPENEMFVQLGHAKQPPQFTPPAYSPTPTPTSYPHMSGMSLPRYERQQFLHPHHV